MKRHINEFYKTSLANNGRAAGMGIMEDKYGDEDFQNHSKQRQPMFENNRKGEDGEVVTHKASEV